MGTDGGAVVPVLVRCARSAAYWRKRAVVVTHVPRSAALAHRSAVLQHTFSAMSPGQRPHVQKAGTWAAILERRAIQPSAWNGRLSVSPLSSSSRWSVRAPIANAHTDYQPRTGGKRARAHRQVSAANADSPQDSLAARAYWAVALGRHRGPRPATADETATPSSRTRERGVTAWSAHNARALAGSEAHAGGALSHTHACAQTLNEATPTTHAHNTNGTRAHAYGPQRHEGAITPITRHA